MAPLAAVIHLMIEYTMIWNFGVDGLNMTRFFTQIVSWIAPCLRICLPICLPDRVPVAKCSLTI